MIEDGVVSFHDAMAPLMRAIDSVHPHEMNYNNGDVELIMDSIMANGMYRPVYVEKGTDRIIAGNHTWMACKELGATQIPVAELDVADATAKRIMVGDNEIARKARRDDGLLVQILRELNQDGGLLGTGITQAELTQLTALADMPFEPPDEGEHRMWPTLCFQVPPHVKRAFYDMTEMAGGDRERFELMLRLAGWSK